MFCIGVWADDTPQQKQIRAKTEVSTEADHIITMLQTNPRFYDRQSLANIYWNLNAITDPVKRSTLQSLVQHQMSDEGLSEPFAAVLDTSAEITDTGTGNVPSATGSLQPQAKGLITWESSHFGHQKADDETMSGSSSVHHPDFSFGGQFGYAPVFTLVNLTNASGAALSPKARPMFQQGFVWSIRPQLNVPLFQFLHDQLSSELAVFGEVGETILTSSVTSFKQSNDTITATLVSNNVGNGATYFESGIQFRLYNSDLATVHLNKNYLTPKFYVESGFKVDDRFKAEGDLAGYDSPRNRAFVRFLVSLTNIRKTLGTADPKDSFSVDFGVDREMPISESRVPASTRIIIRGSLDIMKLLKGSQ